MVSIQLKEVLRKLADPAIAEHSQRFFKTGKGEYGEGDRFLGVRVPVIRRQVNKFKDVTLQKVKALLKSVYHEERLFSLLTMVDICRRGDDKVRKKIYSLYLKNTKFINNWDLVDLSAGDIVGSYLMTRDRKPIYKLAESKDLWERRISILSTFYFIKNNFFDDTLNIAIIILHDREDLIHKAVGWMLREVGKRDVKAEEGFLKK